MPVTFQRTAHPAAHRAAPRLFVRAHRALGAEGPSGQCDAYRRAVAQLPCVCCGLFGYTECADTAQSSASGADIDTIPLCTNSAGHRGCKQMLRAGVLMSEVTGCELVPDWIADTQRRVHALGLWPAGVVYPHTADAGAAYDVPSLLPD